MARRSYDPWSKKSKKGMQLLNNMFKTTYRLGKAASKSSTKKRAIKATTNKGCMFILSFMVASITLILIVIIF